jgi:hypothetical protein
MNFDEKDGFNLNDLARRLANIIRLGQIFAIDYEAAKALLNATRAFKNQNLMLQLSD